MKKLPGSDNSHSSSMEGPTLVPCSAGNALRLSSTATPLTESIPADVRHETDEPTTSTGHSRRSLNVTTFQSQLKNPSYHRRGAKHPKIMTPSSRSGWAGVLNMVVIPFQDPFLR